MSSFPFVSIIVLNYFGENVISHTLDSLVNQTYPEEKMEIIVIDNNSLDKSRPIISLYAKKFKNIRYKFLPKNIGFASGNNEGIKMARGKYVALVNNDCTPDREWLYHLVNEAEKDTNTFAVSSRIMLYPKFFQIKISKPYNYTIEKVNLSHSPLLRFTRDKAVPIFFKTEEGEILCDIPFDPEKKQSITIDLTFRKKNANTITNDTSIRVLNFSKSTFTSNKKSEFGHTIVYSLNIDLDGLDLRKFSFEKIQNAGILMFQDGYGRDIGAKVRYMTQDYETYTNQYNKSKEIYAACGAAVMYRKDLLKKLGYLNEEFFMYYEDVDISERARLAKYTIRYCPKAVVRHLHALSSGEWSPFFIYQTERGRLLHVFFNFPFRVFLYQYLSFVLKSIGRLTLNIYSIKSLQISVQYLLLALNLFLIMPSIITKRRHLLKNINRAEIGNEYQKILSGYWYTH